MKKPKKTLKDLLRLEALLTKQTERTEKAVSRRREKGDKENPVTSVFHARVAARQKSAQDDLSEIRRLVEEVSLRVAGEEEAKHGGKDASSKDKPSSDPKATRKSKSADAAAPAPAGAETAKTVARRAPRPRKPASEAQA